MTHQNISYIPLELAARKYGLSKKALRQKVDSGKLSYAKTPSGDLLVADHGIDQSLNIKREDYEHLRGRKISVRDAAKKYNIAPMTFSRWAKAGYITVLDRGWKVKMDEADVAYGHAVYKAKYDFYDGQMSGVTIFDKAGKTSFFLS